MPHSEVNRAFVLGIGFGFFVGAVVMWAVLTLADMARHFLRRREAKRLVKLFATADALRPGAPSEEGAKGQVDVPTKEP